ncbi:putative NRPS-like enzyme [Daldinia caldariorum]|uniref:putative NRPS-like enzyme n=1 Tax=Daldinia caldariorum TaxID=326644 RepID=UPI002007821B|nr:putative NRPS-like enzyme [Daldinia caldariorum]KAI1473095.1 putative NRPS-like enzyme [Daldinia caldariorum]
MAAAHSNIARWQHDLLPHIVDRLARESPDVAYGLWPTASASYHAGFETITYSQFANAVNGLAWWLVQQLGPGHGDVITYVGPNDVRLTALLVAAIKTHHVVFLTSPRNSAAAHSVLFETLKCKTLVTTDPVPPPALAIIEAVQPRRLIAPDLDDLVGKTHQHYNCDRTYEKNCWDPIWAIHTSGSTGFPKPIIWTSEAVARHHNGSDYTPLEGVPSLDHFLRGKRVLTTLPSFHGAGLAQYLFYAVPFGNTVIAPTAAAIPTAQGIMAALKQTTADVAILVPSVVAELAQDPVCLDYVAANLKLIVYIGGDLPQAVGDRVAAKIPLRCQWGASEVGLPHQLWPSELGPQDWRYIRFHPCTGAVFEESLTGTYELVFRKKTSLAATQPVFSILGQDQLEEYRTRDLFEPHPTVADAWCWRARVDDVIVFLNGEKTNPIMMEQSTVAKNPELSGAIVVGTQRFQAALLVEPVPTVAAISTADQAALIERIWPSIDEANSIAPAHARVEKSMILVTVPERPMIRTGKGTIQRDASVAQYSKEFDKLYSDANAILEDEISDEMPNLTDTNMVTQLIRDAILITTGWHDVADSTNFFDNGMDSLQALRITRALRRGLRRNNIALSTVYQNPTIVQLKTAIITQRSGEDDGAIMQSLLSTYQGLIHQIESSKSSNTNHSGTIDVVLTGSTGTLGTFILRALLDHRSIGHIFCLNRSADGGRAAQWDRFKATNLTGKGLDDRVTFLQSNLALPLLGLEEATYETLRSRVGLIVHNAWPVNFNLGLLSFRPQLAGIVNLFALSNASTTQKMKLLFISSVGVVTGSSSSSELAQESLVELQSTPHSNGYSRSKLLAEHLCHYGARHLGVPVAIARVGQVAGAIHTKGIWNPSEWLPSLVIGSRQLGCLPNNLGPQFSVIDWVPVDALADIVVDLVAHLTGDETWGSKGAEVFNLRNPSTTTWEGLLPVIKEGIESHLGRAVDVVPPETWLAQLQTTTEVVMTESEEVISKDIAGTNPAIKLLEFYQNGLWSEDQVTASMAVERALAISPTLQELSPVRHSWMRKWVDEWLASISAENTAARG